MYSKQTFLQRLARTDFLAASSIGIVKGVTPGVKFGYGEDIPVAGADIWPENISYIFPDAAGETVNVVSSSASDTSSNIKIEGLNEDGVEISEIISLSGTTPIISTNNYTAINRAYTYGETKTIGDITISSIDDETIYAFISATDQQSQQIPYKVPSDKVFLLLKLDTSVNKSSGTDLEVVYRVNVKNKTGVKRTRLRFGLQKSGTTAIVSTPAVKAIFSPGAEISIFAIPSKTADVSAYMEFLLIDKTFFTEDFLENLENS